MKTSTEEKFTKIKCKMCNYTLKYNTHIPYATKMKEHMIKEHNLYFKENYIDYCDLIDKKTVTYIHCPYCNFKSSDSTNNTGRFTVHLARHKITWEQHVKKYPEDSYLFNYIIKKNNKEKELLSSIDNWIECKVCGKKMKKLVRSHLELHNLTPTEYKLKYNVKKTTSDATSKLQSTLTHEQFRIAKEKAIATNTKLPWHTKEANIKRVNNLVSSNYEKYKELISKEFEVLFNVNEYYKNKLHVKCKNCGHEFTAKYRKFCCQKCSPYYKGSSNAEFEVGEFIKSLDVDMEILRGVRGLMGDRKEIDIFIPGRDIGIEYNGIFWHSEISGNTPPNAHLTKYQLCKENDIKLIQIFSSEWKNNKDAVKNEICNIMNFYNRYINIDDCIVKNVSENEKNNYLTKNCLFGNSDDDIALGLYHLNELVTILTIKHINDNNYKILRYNQIVALDEMGPIFYSGLQKLLNYFISKYNPTKIEVDIDLRWDNSDLYEALNFKLVKYINPTYWYIDGYEHISNKNLYTKDIIIEKMNGNKSLSEWQNMQQFGYDRIWDCGSAKFEWTRN